MFWFRNSFNFDRCYQSVSIESGLMTHIPGLKLGVVDGDIFIRQGFQINNNPIQTPNAETNVTGIETLPTRKTSR